MVNVVYFPQLLKSMSEICKAFGVGDRRVVEWVNAGAPIAVEGEGVKIRYSAEMVRLQVWREGYSQKNLEKCE